MNIYIYTLSMGIICNFNVHEIDKANHFHDHVQSVTLPYHTVNISIQPVARFGCGEVSGIPDTSLFFHNKICCFLIR